VLPTRVSVRPASLRGQDVRFESAERGAGAQRGSGRNLNTRSRDGRAGLVREGAWAAPSAIASGADASSALGRHDGSVDGRARGGRARRGRDQADETTRAPASGRLKSRSGAGRLTRRRVGGRALDASVRSWRQARQTKRARGTARSSGAVERTRRGHSRQWHRFSSIVDASECRSSLSDASSRLRQRIERVRLRTKSQRLQKIDLRHLITRRLRVVQADSRMVRRGLHASRAPADDSARR